ncbi:MAG: 50S ribosomal protein L35 [Verrucomicrobia bacterium]|nr:MAG: 50S ribosomal protein L35 [Verrucomicrobiota bacterium]
MPKMKTKKCAAKRFKKTGTGKLKRNHMGGSHILTNKNRKHKRTLRGSDLVDKADMKRIMPYI